ALPVGVALGASGHAWLANQKAAPAAPIVAAAVHVAGSPLPTAAPAASAEMVPVAAPPTSVIAPSPPSPATAPSRRLVARATAPSHGAARELSQLEKARTLLSEGRTAATLSLLRSHFARYRHSSFEQERQALFIKALVEDHQLVEARTRAAAFVRRFPKSTLRASVESAVAPIP
ncbi:MAG TPA: hypothetical protein VNG33_07205, partial [Polyangiaceae bacterium]|nr:hypothetical protein [Polyangiaceae bacterium]